MGYDIGLISFFYVCNLDSCLFISMRFFVCRRTPFSKSTRKEHEILRNIVDLGRLLPGGKIYCSCTESRGSMDVSSSSILPTLVDISDFGLVSQEVSVISTDRNTDFD